MEKRGGRMVRGERERRDLGSGDTGQQPALVTCLSPSLSAPPPWLSPPGVSNTVKALDLGESCQLQDCLELHVYAGLRGGQSDLYAPHPF